MNNVHNSLISKHQISIDEMMYQENQSSLSSRLANSAGAIEYTNCFSAEG